MQYEIIQPGEDSQIQRARLTFEGQEEIDAVAYAYSEHIRRLHDVGNPSSVSAFDMHMADPNQSRTSKERVFKPVTPNDINAKSIIDILQAFVDNTTEAVKRILETSEPPMYAGLDVGERENAAKTAGRLIAEIGKRATEATPEEVLEVGQADVDSMMNGIIQLLKDRDTGTA